MLVAFAAAAVRRGVAHCLWWRRKTDITYIFANHVKSEMSPDSVQCIPHPPMPPFHLSRELSVTALPSLTYLNVCACKSILRAKNHLLMKIYCVETWSHSGMKGVKTPCIMSLSYFSDKVFPVHYVYPSRKCDWIFGNISYKYWGYVRL